MASPIPVNRMANQDRAKADMIQKSLTPYLATLSNEDDLVFYIHPSGVVAEFLASSLVIWNKRFLTDTIFVAQLPFIYRYPERLLKYPILIARWTASEKSMALQWWAASQNYLSDALRTSLRLADELNVETFKLYPVTSFAAGNPVSIEKTGTATDVKRLFTKTGVTRMAAMLDEASNKPTDAKLRLNKNA